MFCENCGKQLEKDSAFCQECGSKVEFTGEEAQIKEASIEETQIKERQRSEEGNKISDGPATLDQRGQRGPVPPAMRQTRPQQPAKAYREEAVPRQPAEPYKAIQRQEADPYRREEAFQTSESCRGGTADIIGFGQYIFMIFISWIPIINIILLLKWASNKQKPNKGNFAKAMLFYYLLAVIIYLAYIWLWLKATGSI